jgi:DNA-binding beta-propeller fold protein YncE
LGPHIATTDTDGTSLTSVALGSWSVTATPGVPLGDEIATDAPLDAFFVTERELNGKGGVVRVTSRGLSSVVTGTTAEGIAVDEARQRIYVADVNDDAVSAVDARAMRVLYRIGGLPRAFSLALSADGRHLFVVSNQGVRTPFGAPGSVTELALYPRPRVVAKSAALSFPIGIALDSAHGTVFVTDEEADVIDVLDEHTLQPRHAPLSTCATPWKPAIDAQSGRLFVPCAGSDEVDAFDARTLARVRGAPFSTGGYPLAVTVVRP